MHVFIIHNEYQEIGGEDKVFQAEKMLLQDNGQGVSWYLRSNSEIANYSFSRKLGAIWNTAWSRKSYAELVDRFMRKRPDVAHHHNTFPLISPSSYYACRKFGLPVVQTLHNYRLMCAGGTFYRNGVVCEDCMNRESNLFGILHACYRNSRIQTATVAMMLKFHQGLKTWKEKVDIYIALTQFAKKKFIEGGLPRKKIVVKPNFVYPDPGAPKKSGNYALFVGRLSPEKGIMTVLRAWRYVKQIPLILVGDGPLMPQVEGFAREQKKLNLQILGVRSHQEVLQIVKEARFLICPSECYENFPMVVVEAFACGVPAIVSKFGAMNEIVEDGRTGLTFTPKDPEALAEKVNWAWAYAKKAQEMGKEARKEFEGKYTAERNYEMLMDIYKKAIENKNS